MSTTAKGKLALLAVLVALAAILWKRVVPDPSRSYAKKSAHTTQGTTEITNTKNAGGRLSNLETNVSLREHHQNKKTGVERVAHTGRKELSSRAIIMTDSLENAGTATAEAALETFLWSVVQEDRAVLEDVTVLSPYMKIDGIDGWKLDRSAEGRGRLKEWKDAFLADAIHHARTVGAIQMADLREFGSDRVITRVHFLHENGTETTEVVFLRRTPDGWRRDVGWTPESGIPSAGAAAGRK